LFSSSGILGRSKLTWMRGTECVAYRGGGGRTDMFTEFLRINLKGRGNSKNLDIDGRIILKCILRNEIVECGLD